MAGTHGGRRYKNQSTVRDRRRHILTMLKTGDMTAVQMFARFETIDPAMSIAVLRDGIGRMKGLIHICGWDYEAIRQTGGLTQIAIYRHGPGEDMPRPPRQSTEMRAAKVRATQAKTDADDIDLLPVRRSGAEVFVHRDPLIEALYGRAA